MTTSLENYQFEILPSEAATSGVVFGIGSGEVDMEDGGFIPGDDDWLIDDADDSFNGGTRFGRDVLRGVTHGFNLFTNCSDEDTALAALSRFKTAWRALSVRSSPSDVVPCRYRINDRYRRFYGRPRRFSAPPTNLILGGLITITTDFVAADAYFYDDAETSETFTIRQNTDGSGTGFTFPITFPANSVPVGTGSGQLVVGGDAPAYPIIRFNGPVTNPRLEADDWSLELSVAIPSGEYIEIDTRPWKRTIKLNGTSSYPQALTANRRQYISDVVLQPGRQTVSFWGSAASGTPTCAVRWRNTYSSY